MLIPALVALCSGLIQQPPAAPNPPFTEVVIGANLIDGTGTAPVLNSVVLIEDGRIKAVGKVDGDHFLTLAGEPLELPSGTVRLFAKGKWIIPGLIDSHVHIDEVMDPAEFTKYGVTTVRDVGSRLGSIQKLKKLASQFPRYPNVWWMGRNIDESKPSWWGAVAAKNVADVSRIIDEMDRQGVDGVKLYVNAGPAVTAEVIKQAHDKGWPVTAHLKKTSPLQAVLAGIDNLEHIATLFPQFEPKSATKLEDNWYAGYARAATADPGCEEAKALLKFMVRRGTVLTPTFVSSSLPVLGKAEAEKAYGFEIPDLWLTEWKRPYWDFMKPVGWSRAQTATAKLAIWNYTDYLHMAIKAHVPMIAGTDTPAPFVLPGASLLVELETLVKDGMPPIEAIHCATGRPAALMHRDDELGVLKAGRQADFVLINGNPLVHFSDIHRIAGVYRKGVRVKN
jgi:imidazolonepropionase-like amidohydrolase